jgi:hypothetical protein
MGNAVWVGWPVAVGVVEGNAWDKVGLASDVAVGSGVYVAVGIAKAVCVYPI